MKQYSFDSILGNEDAKDYFISRLQNNNLGHAYIISGPDGCGRKTMALNVIAAVSCESQNAPCGECDNCKKILSDTCVDIYTVKKPTDRVYIPIAAIRAIYDTVYLVPNDLSLKAYIIDGGELMQPSAQNALLKLLEEPPTNAVFFIITNDPSSLLPTILSRSFTVHMKPLPTEVIKEHLIRKYACTDAKAEKISEVCGGSLGKATDLITDKTASDKPSTDAVKLLDALCSDCGKFDFICMHHSMFKKSAEMFSAYEKLMYAFRDIAVYNSDIDSPPLFFRTFDECASYGDLISTAAALGAVTVLSESMSMLKTATRPQLTLTEYSVKLYNSIHKAKSKA